MTRWTLSETLTALVEGATPEHPGITIEAAEIALPMLVTMEHGTHGPLFRAQPPFSAYHSGFEPVAHRARLRVEQTATDQAVPATPAATDLPG